MKTSELTGAALDWAVMHCEHPDNSISFFFKLRALHALHSSFYYSTNWAQGGPIIERKRLNLRASDAGDWIASTHDMPHPDRLIQYGPTALIAAMRCYVASKLGDTVEIPEEIAK